VHDVAIDKISIETVDPSCCGFNGRRPQTAILLMLDVSADVFSRNRFDMPPADGFEVNEKCEKDDLVASDGMLRATIAVQVDKVSPDEILAEEACFVHSPEKILERR
jgi:hypothetical protein